MRIVSDDEIRAAILEIAKAMYDKRMVNAFEGNVSYRDGQRIYITPSAQCKGYLKSDMIAVVDMSGKQLEGDFFPSSELKMHLECYRLREDVKAVVHTHSPYATAFALANQPIISRAYPEMIVNFGEVPLVEYGTPSTDEICAGFLKYIYDYDALLLANHGVIAMSDDLFDAFFLIEAVENTAKTFVIAKQIGGARDLPPEKLERLHEMRRKRIEDRKRSR